MPVSKPVFFLRQFAEISCSQRIFKAEVRQHATQTHHLDPFNPVNGELFVEFVEGNISTVWAKIVDFVTESQIRSEDDRDYLLNEEMNVIINTFSVREQIGRADYCCKWIADHRK
jgi:hypothetical protein